MSDPGLDRHITHLIVMFLSLLALGALGVGGYASWEVWRAAQETGDGSAAIVIPIMTALGFLIGGVVAICVAVVWECVRFIRSRRQ